MTVPTDRLELVKFRREVFERNQSLQEEIKTLQKTFSNKNKPCGDVEEDLPTVKGSFSVSDALTAK